MGLLDRLLGKDYGSDGILTDDEKELRDYENHVYTSESGVTDGTYAEFVIGDSFYTAKKGLVTTGTVEEKNNLSWGHWLSNKAIRDNEVQFFWDSFGSGTATVNFTFRAARRGIYPVPPVQAECMYEPETFGRGDGYLCIIE